MERENCESSSSGVSGKGKTPEMEEQPDAGEVDELLAALGYKVRSSEMADVALNLEQLENAMGSSAAIHYNPSDLSGWFESMLCEINAPLPHDHQRLQDFGADFSFPEPSTVNFADILHMHLKFAHFTANQAILESFAGCRRVHVIDFGIKQGMQWPPLIQALALRPGGPPSFRLTGIGPPQPDNSDQQVGYNLANLAHAIHVDFKYCGLVTNNLADLKPYMLESPPPAAGQEPEAIAVNSVFELHRLLARQGGIEKVLSTVRALRPRIVTVVEQEANHNAVQFVERFTEALHYYSTMFDSLESCGATPEQQNDRMMSEVYLGRQIVNVIGCEGVERTERHETLSQWQGRLSSAGFDPVHLGSNAFKQASTLLALFAGGDGYRVEERDGCLTLGWHTRPLIATSAWRPAQ